MDARCRHILYRNIQMSFGEALNKSRNGKQSGVASDAKDVKCLRVFFYLHSGDCMTGIILLLDGTRWHFGLMRTVWRLHI